MVLSFTDDFKVIWKEPADAGLTWMPDLQHLPRPLPPLVQDMLARLMSREGTGLFAREVFVNGYAFFTRGGGQTRNPEVVSRGERDVWENDYLPAVRANCAWIRAQDYESMTAAEIVAMLDELLSKAGEVAQLAMQVAPVIIRATRLIVFCEEALGTGGGPLAAALLQGIENETQLAGVRMVALANLAARSPEVAAALREGRYGEIEAAAGGAEFNRAFCEFLDEYGWRVESNAMVHTPTWTEQPEVPLALIAGYLMKPESSPDVAFKRAVQQRDAALREVESRLPAEKLPRFRELASAAEDFVVVSESRGLWFLTASGSMRVPLLALGRKLQASGVLDRPDDVFFLHRDELEQVAASPRSMHAEGARRRSDLERWERLNPPPFIGVPRGAGAGPAIAVPAETLATIRLKFAFAGGPPDAEGPIKGQAASAGLVRGPARVILGLHEAELLEPGDILVCRATAPPWTPLFAIAAGVVTDDGGILSHSAIVAREYAIPCVVGTQVATQRIPDGAMIEVDGTKGTVTLL